MFEQFDNKRQYLGISIDDFSKMLGISRTTYYNWKAERSYPDLLQIEKMAKILNLTIKIY